ncbi:hypothetical protein HOE04_04310 [archaeon]|jgi:hypothetical protein|nr:hypothetical protein [archaeon]
MQQLKKIIKIFFSKIIGLIIFLIILGILNIIAPIINNEILINITSLLNANIILILLFSLFFTLSELFFALVFPFNLPAPIFNSFGSIFLITFLFNIIAFVSTTLNLGLIKILNTFYILIIVIVFLITFITGYITIFSKGVKKTTKTIKQTTENIKHITKAIKEKQKTKIQKSKTKTKNKKEKFKKVPSEKTTLKDVKDEIKKKK